MHEGTDDGADQMTRSSVERSYTDCMREWIYYVVMVAVGEEMSGERGRQ